MPRSLNGWKDLSNPLKIIHTGKTHLYIYVLEVFVNERKNDLFK